MGFRVASLCSSVAGVKSPSVIGFGRDRQQLKALVHFAHPEATGPAIDANDSGPFSPLSALNAI